MSKCKSCKAPIIWVSLKNKQGKYSPHPINARPVKGIILEAQTSANMHVKGLPAFMADVYTSHFATCPNAAEHRKKNQERLF